MDELLDDLREKGGEVDDVLDRLMNDKEIYIEYLLKFVDNDNMDKLKQAVENKDSDTAMKEVHTLKGVALNLGLLPLVDVTMDMLLDFREGRADEAFQQIDDVENEFNEWKEIIAKYKK